MPSPSKNKDIGLAALLAVVVAAAGLLPLAYHYGQRHRTVPGEGPVASVPAPAPGTDSDTDAAEPPPPGAEVVPAEEAETDRGPSSASPAGPTLSFARAAGLHNTPDPLRLNSSVALVVDLDSGEVLVRKNEQSVLPIASLTKIMSALLVLEARQPMDEVLTITEEDVDRERHSRSRLRVGTQLTRQEALQLALMSSENRAAHALGRAYPGGLTRLVEAMNLKARELGMNNTSYVDPTGLSNRNQSTAQDLALLVRAAARHPLLAEFSTTPAHLAALGGRTLMYRNSNRLVRNDAAGWDIALQKTGYIVEAGRCLTMVTKVAGHNLIMVLLDADSNAARLADARKLRQWVVAQNGWQDDVLVARADSERAAPRKVAATKASPDAKRNKGKDVQVAKKRERQETKLASKKKQDMTVASAASQDRKAATARKAGKVASARKQEKVAAARKGEKPAATRKNDARVRQTFAARTQDEKS